MKLILELAEKVLSKDYYDLMLKVIPILKKYINN